MMPESVNPASVNADVAARILLIVDFVIVLLVRTSLRAPTPI
ncbi:hypothetical protein ARTHRO9V_230096 [Arthrobacter sp. 9V]|nr:hypothetical protein ARTHRO9V_230096 [Arthrobacter sp. 9V]